jgi:hypothetical protein
VAVSIPDLVAELAAAFPRQPVTADNVRAYARALDDLPLTVLTATVRELVRTSRFFPTVAEIREAAAERTLGLPSEAEALEQVEIRARWARDHDGQETPFVHPLVGAAVDHVGGWFALRTTDRPDVLRGQLLRLYREGRAAAVREFQVGRELAAGATRQELGE